MSLVLAVARARCRTYCLRLGSTIADGGDAEVCGESKDQVKRYVPAALNLGDVLARDPRWQ